jgi:hypothetical protein
LLWHWFPVVHGSPLASGPHCASIVQPPPVLLVEELEALAAPAPLAEELETLAPPLPLDVIVASPPPEPPMPPEPPVPPEASYFPSSSIQFALTTPKTPAPHSARSHFVLFIGSSPQRRAHRPRGWGSSSGPP